MVLLDVDQIFLVILLIILAIVIYFELRFMRSRNKEYMNNMMDKDDAYNTIATTKAIAATLKQKGRDTREADLVLIQAEQAYKRGNFLSSRELARKAREILIKAPTLELSVPQAESVKTETLSEEERRTLYEVKKLEPNMMESRFIINSCRDRIAAEEGSGKDLEQAREHLARAEACFEEKRYGEALREGLITRRMVGEPQIVTGPKKESPIIIKVPKPERKCGKCGTPASPEDRFCRNCGENLEDKRTCPYCQAELKAEDAFCPKCGRRI